MSKQRVMTQGRRAQEAVSGWADGVGRGRARTQLQCKDMNGTRAQLGLDFAFVY